MTAVTSSRAADELDARPAKRRRDLAALTGALFVLAAVGAFIAGGNTPHGDASADAVIAHYSANRAQGIVASIILALVAVPTLAFAARLRERARLAIGADRTLPNFAFAAGAVTAAGFLGAAAIHFALADYARDLDLSAAQALNALDADSFILFATGIATLVFAGSLIALRSRLLPVWLGLTGIPIAIAMFTPVAFFAACAAGAWIIVTSLLLYAIDPETSGRVQTARGADGGARATPLTPTLRG